MAKRKSTESYDSGSNFVARELESEQTILDEVIKPHVDAFLKEKIDQLRAKGFDNNRIAATLMIHRHVVDSL